MPYWYYDKKVLKNTPSSVDNIDYATEMRYRKEGARFIIDTGSKMDLGYNTTATGVVYFHRFYMFHSFRQFPRYVTACCCLFLAGKVEETPKKCKDIIKTARGLLSDQKFATFGDDPKEEVMTLERILLQTIKFDLQVEHPYSYLLRYAKCLKGDKVKLQKMVQMAWTFVNDSLCTTLSLQWEPEIIAIALMYLAGKLSQFEVLDWAGRTMKHLRWWDMFVEDITMELLEDICHQVLDLYASNQARPEPQDSPPLQRVATTSTSGQINSGNGRVHTNGPDIKIEPGTGPLSEMSNLHNKTTPMKNSGIISGGSASTSKQVASPDMIHHAQAAAAAAAAAAYGYPPSMTPSVAAAIRNVTGQPYASYVTPPPSTGGVLSGAHLSGPPPGPHLASYPPPPYGGPNSHYNMPPQQSGAQPAPVVPQYYTPPPVAPTIPPPHRPAYYK